MSNTRPTGAVTGAAVQLDWINTQTGAAGVLTGTLAEAGEHGCMIVDDMGRRHGYFAWYAGNIITRTWTLPDRSC